MLFSDLASFNPLAVILKEHKLEGPNYVDWKRNLDIVLTAEEYKFVLYEPCLELPAEAATEQQLQDHKKWVKADEMARCYILASMSSVLQHQHQNTCTAYEIMYSLKEMFGDQDRATRQVAMKQLFNISMHEGSPIREHVLKIMNLLNELEILGADIDGES